MVIHDWRIKPHTRAKHALLEQYLKGWYAIIGAREKRAVFLDGFAGRGVYDDGSDGSPMIALRTLLGHSSFARLSGCRFVFLFVEKDEANYASLRREVEQLEPFPANVRVEPIRSTFDGFAARLTDQLAEAKKQLAPTFAFIDPFGFTGFPMATIGELLSFRKCEVFVNFMADHVNRFAETPGQRDTMDSLFGCRDYREVSQHPDRREFLADLYKRQLQEVAGFKFVSRFEMRRETERTAYYLLHGTNHLLGVEKMKAAMWNVDPGGGSCFSDRFDGQVVLLSGANADFGPLRRGMCQHFAGQTVTPTDVKRYTLVETPYGPSHWNQLALKPLEAEGRITVCRPAGGRRGTFPENKDVEISFPP